MPKHSNMKSSKHFIAILLLLAMVIHTGCSNFDEINTNPNTPSSVSSQMLATTLILDIARQPSQKSFLVDDMMGKYIAWSEFVQGEQYNRIERADFDELIVLNNIDKMVEFAPSEALKNSYTALGHFVKAYKYFELTMRVGDVPFKDALKGESETIYYPAYNSQKEVFLGILDELAEADRLFAIGADFDGDPIYGGSTAHWRKLANTFVLKVLINLSNQADDADLNVKGRFQEILNSKPIFESNFDNFQIVYSDKENQRYPFHKLGNNFIIYNMVGSPIIDSLKSLQDYRLFYYAKPSPVALTGGAQANEWDAYKGIDPSVEFTVLSEVASSKDYSPMNDRYTEIPEGEPTFLMSYSQMNFIIAEAAARSWVSEDPVEYYEKGIRSAMNFVANHTPDDEQFHHGMQITPAYVDQYLASAPVQLKSTFEEQLKQIMTQKYIANYLQTPWETYFEYRRTGYPELPVNPQTNLNEVKTQLPKRWMYPQDELDYNMENVSSAIDSQFGGNDNVNAVMWLIKE